VKAHAPVILAVVPVVSLLEQKSAWSMETIRTLRM
jgi:hypothetical protein